MLKKIVKNKNNFFSYLEQKAEPQHGSSRSFNVTVLNNKHAVHSYGAVIKQYGF